MFPLCFLAVNVKMNPRFSHVSLFIATDSCRSWLRTLPCVWRHSDLTCGDILDLLLFTPPQGHRVVQLIVFWRFTSIRTLRLSQHYCCSSGHTSGLCSRILNPLWASFSFFFCFFLRHWISGSDEAGMKLWTRVFLTGIDRISEKFRRTARVGCLGDEARLRWFGCVQKRVIEYISRGVLRLKLASRRSVRRSKQRFMDGLKGDENLDGVRVDDQRGGLDGGRWLAVGVSDRTVV